MKYYRPVARYGDVRPKDAMSLAGGATWFSDVEVLSRDKAPHWISASELPKEIRERLCVSRSNFADLKMDHAQVMGVLNTTPDSFSDGGLHETEDAAIARGYEMLAQGASIIDVGGESTRPGADFVDRFAETNRVTPVVTELAKTALVSIDTRKADVARTAMSKGARIFNDVTALSFDPRSLNVLAETDASVCLMHASGDPKTMQDAPSYDNVLLDVYDYLASRVDLCLQAGIDRSKICIDPGIGFGKTLEHNMLLIKGLSLFHGIGCPLLLGVSRKRFIGEIGQAQNAADRVGGSIAVALEGLRQGVQILRVHDVKETVQAVRLFEAMG
jgi:dihydropteroate synthase